jgi:hypothetical protein
MAITFHLFAEAMLYFEGINPKNCSCLSKNSRKPSTDVAWRFLAHSPYG